MASNKEQRDKALKGFQKVDDRMKLENEIWKNCTRAAFSMGMTNEERMKIIAVNLVTQNQLLLDAVAQLTDRADSLMETLKLIHDDHTLTVQERNDRILVAIAPMERPPMSLSEVPRDVQIPNPFPTEPES